MNILILNGSTRVNGNTNMVTSFIAAELRKRKHIVSEISLYPKDCMNCGHCGEKGACCINDEFSELIKDHYDWILLTSPMHFFGFSGKLKSMLSRLYFMNKEGILLSSVTCGGSESYEDSGYDIVWEQIHRVSRYCNMIEGKPIHFTTYDKIIPLDELKEDILSNIEENEVLYEKIKEGS